MSTEKTLDGFLRPSFELRTIIYAVLTIPVIWLYSDFIGLSDFWAGVCTVLAIAVTWPRIRSWRFIKTYQKNLNNVEGFPLCADEIEWTPTKQWLGRGFSYNVVDAQRVYDAMKPQYAEYFALSKIFVWLRKNELEVDKMRGRVVTMRDKVRVRISKISQKAKLEVGLFGLVFFKAQNPYKPLPPVGGNSIYHAVGVDREDDVYISQDDRTGHTIVWGQSRVGKTVLLRSQITQDLARKDGCCGVFDPKTDGELLGIMWSEVKRLGREEDFYCFLLGDPEISALYNSIADFTRMTAIAGRIANQMSSSGDGAVFRDFAFNFMTYISAALLDMNEQPTFKNIKSSIENLEGLFNRYGRYLMKRDNPTYLEELQELEKPKFKQNAKGEVVEDKMKMGAFAGRDYKTLITDKLTEAFYERNPKLINANFEGLRATMKSDDKHTGKLTASLIPLLTKLTSGEIADILSPNFKKMGETRRTFSWDKIIQRKGCFYVGLSAMQDEVVAQSVGNMFFADLVAKAGEINLDGVNKGLPGGTSQDITPIWLHCDEIQSLMDPTFVPLLNRSGSAGVRVTGYTQVLSDIEAKLGDAAMARVVLGNFNTCIMFRVADEATAKYLTDQLHNVDFLGLDVQSSVNDGGAITPKASFDDEDIGKGGGGGFFNTSTRLGVGIELNDKIVSPATIMSLPKGQAFAFINRKHLYKLRFALLKAAKGTETPTLEQVRAELRARQIRPERF